MLMAYYPTFQPYPYQDQLNQLRNQNPMPMQGFQMPMSRPDQNGLNWVQGEAGAKSWFVNPGATVLLMDSENQRFYVKSADMNGMPAMRTFQYTEVGQTSQTIPQQAQFVTVEEFNGFKSEIMSRLSDREKGESHE
jgi:hypothetical protein